MWSVFKVVNLFYLLVSSYVWFSFLLPLNILPVAVSALMLACFAFAKFKIQLSQRVYAIWGVIMLYFIYNLYILGPSYALLTLFSYLPASLIFMLDRDKQKSLLTFLTKWLAIILGSALIAYIAHWFVSLPHFFFHPTGTENYPGFDNYFVFLTSEYYGEGSDIGRFSGPFIEPGHQALICVFLMFANRFDFKRQPWLWVLLVSIFFSLSLAGFVLLLLGLVMIKLRNIRTMIGLSFIIGGGWAFVTTVWNGGDNPFNLMVVSRLEYDDKKGIVGNNRTIKQTDFYFDQCIADGTIWTGVKTQKAESLKIRGAGYKIFLLRYGVIGALFVLVLYSMLINPKCNRRYAVCFLIFVFLSFLQRAYPGWYGWLASFVLGTGIMRNELLFTPEGDKKQYKKLKRRRKNRKINRISNKLSNNAESLIPDFKMKESADIPLRSL